MHVRLKSDAEVRRDALAVAAKKADNGCFSCADSYLRLAKERGASQPDIDLVRRPSILENTAQIHRPRPLDMVDMTDTLRTDPDRLVDLTTQLPVIDKASERVRVLRKAGAMVAAGGAATLAAGSRVITAEAYSGSFGTDSNTQPHVAGMPSDFYIGKLGEGSTSTYRSQPLPYVFNTNSAGATNEYRVTGYWFMYGPYGRSSGYTPYTWGFLQGQNAIAAWNYNPWCCMENLFADIESSGSGSTWTSSSVWDNADCANGFMDGVTASYAVTCDGARDRFLTPGLYFNLGKDGHLFPGGWAPKQPFVFWGAGAYSGRPSCPGSAGNCGPCANGCNTLTPVINNWNAGVYHGCWGGQGIQIWQFWIGACGCGGDWDYSPFTPREAPRGKWAPIGCR